MHNIQGSKKCCPCGQTPAHLHWASVVQRCALSTLGCGSGQFTNHCTRTQKITHILKAHLPATIGSGDGTERARWIDCRARSHSQSDGIPRDGGVWRTKDCSFGVATLQHLDDERFVFVFFICMSRMHSAQPHKFHRPTS